MCNNPEVLTYDWIKTGGRSRRVDCDKWFVNRPLRWPAPSIVERPRQRSGRLTNHLSQSIDHCAGLLLPSLNVHAHHEEPHHHQSFHHETCGQIVGEKMVCERRWQKGKPT